MDDKATGRVFDIQRGAVHDGPGLRTTVFLQGCPLRCRWCHNPESQDSWPQLGYWAESCVGCGACVEACSRQAHHLERGIHRIDRGRCSRCMACVSACPHGALRTMGRTMTVDEVMREVRQDRVFYRASGGGVTISGGEPMAQPNFVLRLLERSRQEGISTCLDTSGAASPDAFRAVASWVDLFLFDCKATDSDRHKELTGVGNEEILANLDLLYRGGAAIWLRCPLVPGLNDDDAHLRGIADISRRYPNLKGVEILPFHATGRHKYDRLGRPNPMGDTIDASDDQASRWIARLRELGCPALQPA